MGEEKPFCSLLMLQPKNLLEVVGSIKLKIQDTKGQSKKLTKCFTGNSKDKANPQWMNIVNALRENDMILLSCEKMEDSKGKS